MPAQSFCTDLGNGYENYQPGGFNPRLIGLVGGVVKVDVALNPGTFWPTLQQYVLQ
jgi:hypothetical protein